MPSDKGDMRNALRPPVFCLPALLCLALALSASLSACGSSGEDTTSFSTGYNAAIAKLDRASTELATTHATRRTRSSRAIARQLDRFADLLGITSADLHRLKPPTGASVQFKALTAALDESIASARRAAHAARQIQPARQRAALRRLRDSVVEISRAQDALQKAVGAS
jgi:hypothetical protein